MSEYDSDEGIVSATSDEESVDSRGSGGSGGADATEESQSFQPKAVTSDDDLATACRFAIRWQTRGEARKYLDDSASDDVNSETETVDLTKEAEPVPVGKGKKFKHYVFTVNPGHLTVVGKTREEVLRLLVASTEWCIVGCEVASTGTHHLQGAMSFKSARAPSGVLKQVGSLYLKTMNGTPAQARAYCLKEQHRLTFEWGSVPTGTDERKAGSVKGGKATQETYRKIFELADEGKYSTIREDYPGIWAQHGRNLPYLTQLAVPKAHDLPHEPGVSAHFAYGAPGSGKSRWARAKAEAMGYDRVYTKTPENTWWQDYKGEKCVILDDLAPNHVKHQQWEFKKWAEPYVFPVSVKGGGMIIRPEAIIITSNYSLDVLLSQLSSVELAAVKRRYKQYYFAEKEYTTWTSLDPSGLAKKPLEEDGPTYGSYVLPAVRLVPDLHGTEPVVTHPGGVPTVAAPTMNMPGSPRVYPGTNPVSRPGTPVRTVPSVVPGAPIKRKQTNKFVKPSLQKKPKQ